MLTNSDYKYKYEIPEIKNKINTCDLLQIFTRLLYFPCSIFNSAFDG